MAQCKYCQAEIGWSQKDGKPVPLNPDGTPHRCKNNTPAKSTESLTGRLSGYNTGSATFIVRGGGSKTYAILTPTKNDWDNLGYSKNPEVWLEIVLDKDHFVQGFKETPKPAWASDPPVQQPEPAPAAADPAPEEEPTDTCTSPPAPLPGNIRVTVGGTINLQNYENIKVEVEGNSAEECTRILVDTLNGFATNPAYSTTRDLIQSYM